MSAVNVDPLRNDRRRHGRLGVLTCSRPGSSPPVSEPEYGGRLCREAGRLGLDIIIFTPEGISADETAVTGYTLTPDNEWALRTLPVPALVYNRTFIGSRAEGASVRSALAALKAAGSVSWAQPLPGKWAVYDRLRRHPEAAGLLPETRLYTGRRELAAMLAERERGVFLKPAAGSHGKGVLHARLSGGGLRIAGRSRGNAVFTRSYSGLQDGLEWIDRNIGGRTYILQPFLPLETPDGKPFDIRALVQKDESGQWRLTGMAARIGASGSLTSNLHGGGTAVRAAAFLHSAFGHSAPFIEAELKHSSALLPPLLEGAFGRLGELGLDFGLDPGGRLYLLEANSKPGRSVFALAGDRRAAGLSVLRPLHYARHLMASGLRQTALYASSGSRMITMIPKEDS